jgi:hypothetical protein
MISSWPGFRYVLDADILILTANHTAKIMPVEPTLTRPRRVAMTAGNFAHEVVARKKLQAEMTS